MNFWNWIGLPSRADIQELKNASLKQTEALSTLANLDKNVIQLLQNAENISEKSDKLDEAVHTYYEGISQVLLNQSEALSANLHAMETLQQNIHTMDKGTQRTLAQILTECKDQNELLRLLIANSLVNDISNLLDNEEQQ